MFYTRLMKTRKENNDMKNFINGLLNFYAVFFERALYRF